MGNRAITEPLALTTDYVSIDGRYTDANGNPYASVAAAEAALGRRMNQYTVGLTVLVKESGWTEAKEYWVQPKGTTPETYGLVPKSVNLTTKTELSKDEKYYASANVNNRPADVVAETGVVKSLGYKVLNPILSFASQIIEANTVYEIKDSFDIDSQNETIEVEKELTDTIVIGNNRVYYNPTPITISNKRMIFKSSELCLLNDDKTEYKSEQIFDSNTTTSVYAAKYEPLAIGYKIYKNDTLSSENEVKASTEITINNNVYYISSNVSLAAKTEMRVSNNLVILDTANNIISNKYGVYSTLTTTNVRVGRIKSSYNEIFRIVPLISVGNNSRLLFNGGQIVNGGIDVSNTVISQDSKGIFGNNVVITGKPLGIVMADWFNDNSDADKIMHCIDAFGVCNLSARNYIIDKTVRISKSFSLKGQGIPDFFGNYGQRGHAYTENWEYGGSVLVAQPNVECIIKVDKSVNLFCSGIIENVSFTTSALDRSANGIEWCTPGGPSRPVIIRNCGFKFLNYGIYIHKGEYPASNTNTGTITIETNNGTRCNWVIRAEGLYAMGQSCITGNNFEGNVYGAIYTDGNETSSWIVENNEFEGNPTGINMKVGFCMIFLKGNYFETRGGQDLYFRGPDYPTYSKVSFKGNQFTANGCRIHCTYIDIVDFDNNNNSYATLDMSYSYLSDADGVRRITPKISNVCRMEYNLAKNLHELPSADIYFSSANTTYNSMLSKLAPTHIIEGIPLKYFDYNYHEAYFTNSLMKRTFTKGTTYTINFYASCIKPQGAAFTFYVVDVNNSANRTYFIQGKGICIHDNNLFLYRIPFTPEEDIADSYLAFAVDPIDANNTNGIYVSDFFIIEGNTPLYKLPIRVFDPTLIENAKKGTSLYSKILDKNITYNGTSWIEEDGEAAGIKRIGTTSERPTPTKVGFKYYDTTLGKPIYWNGNSWTDANGDYIVDNSGTLQNRLALTSPVKGQQFKLTGGVNDVYLIYGDYGWLKATDGTPWFDDSGTLNAMYNKYNYTLLTEEPSDWATKYNTYYKVVNRVYTKLNALEPWASDTYYKLDVNAYKGIQVKLTDTDTELLNKVVKWNGTKYINIVDNTALKAGTPTITFTTENNTTTATITSTSSGKIYYTKNGDAPTSSSTEYNSAITLADGDQVKAICIRDHMDNSNIGFVPVSVPVITFSNAGILTITCETPNAKIYYTINGSEPSTASTEYDSSASVTIAKGVTVNAIAVLIGRVNSDVASEKRS